MRKVEWVWALSGSVAGPGTCVLPQMPAEVAALGTPFAAGLRPGDKVGLYDYPPVPAMLVSQHGFSQRCLPTTSACNTGLSEPDLNTTLFSGKQSFLFFGAKERTFACMCACVVAKSHSILHPSST